MQLAKDMKKSNACLENEDYDPFQYRSVEHPTSTLGALLHLLKTSLGVGILAMPNAFKNVGLVFGLIGTIIVAFICTHEIYILVKASHTICKRTRTPVLGFSETAAAIFKYGPKNLRRCSLAAEYFVDVCLILTAMACAVYVVFISENLRQLFDYWFPESKVSIYIYMLCIMTPSLLIFQLRELKYLVPFSFVANILVVISYGITFYYMFEDLPGLEDRNLFSHVSALPIFLSTVIFAMEGISIILPLENSMESPQNFLGCGVLITATVIQTALYLTVGFFGYLRFGDATEASITLNLPVHEMPAQLVKLLIALATLASYYLVLYVPMDIIWRKYVSSRVQGSMRKGIAQTVLRCSLVIITVAIAALIPNLETIIGLVGAICLSILGLLIPAILETVLLWDGELGVFKWKLIKNVLLGAFALFVLIFGVADSLG